MDSVAYFIQSKMIKHLGDEYEDTRLASVYGRGAAHVMAFYLIVIELVDIIRWLLS